MKLMMKQGHMLILRSAMVTGVDLICTFELLSIHKLYHTGGYVIFVNTNIYNDPSSWATINFINHSHST